MADVQLPARFANRQQRRSLVQAVTAGLGMASPPYVSIKGGSFTLIDANGEQEPVETKWLDCVIFDTNIEVPIQRVFWGTKTYNPNADTYEQPDCWSDNGVGASSNALNPQSQNCQTCPQNTWGSAVSKVTGKPVKACHVIKKIAVVPVEGKVAQDGTYTITHIESFPFLLRVPVMSHDNLRAYGDKFKGQQFDVSEVVTRISFVHGEVGQLDFEAAGFTDEGTEALVQKFLMSKVTDALVGRGDHPWQGALPAPAQTAPAGQQAGQPAQQAIQSPAAQQASPAPLQAVSEAPKRTRRTKAEMAAAASAENNPNVDGIPSFLRREAPAQPANGPMGGIQQNAPAPNPELEQALANVFGLKT